MNAGLGAVIRERQKAQREAASARYRVKAAVLAARQAGASWTEIGAALGVSSQAAWKRYAGAVAVVQAQDVA